MLFATASVGCAPGPDPALGEWACIDRRAAPLPPETSMDTGVVADTAVESLVDTGPGSILGPTRQACPVEGRTWQLDLRGANADASTDADEPENPVAVFTAIDVASGDFQAVELRASRGDPGTWTLTPFVAVELGPEAPAFADLQLACTLRTPADLGTQILHCAGSHTAFDPEGSAFRETWDLRMTPGP